MKKILFVIILLLSSCSPSDGDKKSENNKTETNIESSGEIQRIVIGDKNAKITIMAFESFTCSHCANFHKDVYPELKKDFLDKGLAKIEFRHFPLDAAAFNASKVSLCKNDGNPDILESLYANQLKWVRGNSIEEANKNLKKYLIDEGFNINFENKELPELKIGANILMSKYNIPEGKILGKKLKLIEETWVQNGFQISDKQVEKIARS